MAATSHGTPAIKSRPSPSVSVPPWNASRAPNAPIKPLSAAAQTLEPGEFSPSYRRRQRNRVGRKRAKREKKRSALKRRSRSSTGNLPLRGGASPPEQDAGAAPEGGNQRRRRRPCAPIDSIAVAARHCTSSPRHGRVSSPCRLCPPRAKTVSAASASLSLSCGTGRVLMNHPVAIARIPCPVLVQEPTSHRHNPQPRRPWLFGCRRAHAHERLTAGPGLGLACRATNLTAVGPILATTLLHEHADTPPRSRRDQADVAYPRAPTGRTAHTRPCATSG